MAYENMTYDFILTCLMDRVTSNYPNLDTREGSMIYNALAPAAMELAIAYVEMNNIRNESFVETASREAIYLKCREIGIDTSIFEASCGIFKGAFNVQIDIGSRWNYDLYNYEVIELIGVNAESNYEYKLACETSGTAPNHVFGTLTPISHLPSGLTYAELTECIVEGENETSDDGIRKIYFETINSFDRDGNADQYTAWCNAYTGIGNSKIIPLWNGANTVKVSILSASNRAASSELIAEFQKYLDPNCEGMGNGVAPIGAFVTVSTATEKPIDISATVKLKVGTSDTSEINTALSKYFAEISYDRSYLSYMNIGAVILGLDSVESISNLTINGSTADMELGTEEIPILGTTNWTVS